MRTLRISEYYFRMNSNKIISQIADQSIEQVSLILNYDDAFNSIIVAEIKNENDSIAKISKLIHILIERLTSLHNIDLIRFQKSISKIYSNPPQDISMLLNWIPQKIQKERKRMQINSEPKKEFLDVYSENSCKNVKLRQEIEHLKKKCVTFTNTIALIKESMENNLQQSNTYLDEIAKLKQINEELAQKLNQKQQIHGVSINSYSTVETQTLSNNDLIASNRPSLARNDYNSLKERFDIVLCELKTLKYEKEKIEKQYLSNIEKLSNLDQQLRNMQIECDASKAKSNDVMIKNNKLTNELQVRNEKYEILSQKCLRYETQISKLKDQLKLNQTGSSPVINPNYFKATKISNENVFSRQLNIDFA